MNEWIQLTLRLLVLSFSLSLSTYHFAFSPSLEPTTIKKGDELKWLVAWELLRWALSPI